jgi:hypothetical protein
MGFIVLKGQGRVLNGYLVKGKISSEGAFECPEDAIPH